MEGRPIWCPLSVLNYQRKESKGIFCNKMVRNLSRTNTFGLFFSGIELKQKTCNCLSRQFFNDGEICFIVQQSIQHSIQLVPTINDHGDSSVILPILHVSHRSIHHQTMAKWSSSRQTQKLKAGCPLHALVNGLSWQGLAGHFAANKRLLIAPQR